MQTLGIEASLDFALSSISTIGSSPQEPRRIFLYSRDFEYLWGVGKHWGTGGLPAKIQELKSLDAIVVWDDVPRDVKHSMFRMEQFLTPLDWVVGLSCRLMLGGSDLPGMRISMILLPNAAGADDSPAYQYFEQFSRMDCRALPWLRVYEPGADASKRRNTLHLAVDLAMCARGILSMEPPSGPASLEWLRRTWIAALTGASADYDHHSLSNVLGPLALTGRADGHIGAQAIYQMMNWLAGQNWAMETDFALSHGPWIKWKQTRWSKPLEKAKVEPENPLNILLIDDGAFECGWADFLARAMEAQSPPGIHSNIAQGADGVVAIGQSVSPPLRLFATAGPDVCLRLVERMAKAGEQAPLALDSDAGVSTEIDVLLLDLRLFQHASLVDEAEFTQQLGALAQRAIEDGYPAVEEPAESLEWAAQTLEQPTLSRRQDRGYKAAITLLARLIASLDPSLPIVLFSSTGRRDLVAQFRKHRNVLLGFQKPRVSQLLSGGAIVEAASGFKEAFGQALDLVPGRRMLRGARRVKTPGSALPAQRPAQFQTEPWHIEVLLDESGGRARKDSLTVGGLVLVLPPGATLEDMDRRLDQEYPGIRSEEGKAFCEQNVSGIASLIAMHCEERRIAAGALCLTGNRNTGAAAQPDDADGLVDFGIADNLHRQLLKMAIETGVFLIGRRLVPQDASVVFNVRAPARSLPAAEFRQLEAVMARRWGTTVEYVGKHSQFWALYEKYKYLLNRGNVPGFSTLMVAQFTDLLRSLHKGRQDGSMKPARTFIRTLGWDAPRGMVETLLAAYAPAGLNFRSDIVRAFPLNTHAQDQGDDVSTTHFFCDLIPRYAHPVHGRNRNPTDLGALWTNGVNDRIDAGFSALLEAYRLALSARPEAVARAGWHLESAMRAGPRSIRSALAAEVFQRACCLDAVGWQAVGERVAAWE